ncbi:MAG: hypothetical protein KAH95_09025 [Spirochaetales bacterium]|nr:hypothetical protein [Spirochaetales bacterium]
MEKNQFHDRVLKHRHSKKGFDELVKIISLHVYSILRNYYKMDDDERSDFFCTFYPKIPGIIKRYKDNGIVFDGYLNKSIIWSIKAYRSAESKQRSLQKASFTEPFFLVSPENDFTETIEIPMSISKSARKALRLEEKGEVLSDTIKQRILYIYLIEANYMDERLKDSIIQITGYKRKWLDTCADKLKTKVERRLDRIRNIRNRRNSAFFKFHILQEKISFAENDNEKNKLKEEISKLRKKIYKMNMIISKAPTRPTHKDIADVLKIPRGSIDSGIHYIKTSFKDMDKKSA